MGPSDPVSESIIYHNLRVSYRLGHTMVEMVTSDLKLGVACLLLKLMHTVFSVRYEQALKTYLSYTVQYKTA